MIYIDWVEGPVDPGILHSTLDKHRLLPDSITDPMVLMAVANSLTIGFLHDGGNSPLAILLESRPSKDLVGIQIITERSHINQRRNELIEASRQLRSRWFDEYKATRVEARIPSERTQTIRILRHFGFKMETLPTGLRNADSFNGVAKNMVIMGLLHTDPYKELREDTAEHNMTVGE